MNRGITLFEVLAWASILVIPMAAVYGIYEDGREQLWWDEHRVKYECRVVEIRQPSSTGQGENTRLHPSQYVYKCADGISYWRTSP